MHALLPKLGALAAPLLAIACGRAPELGNARFHLQMGDLERAEALLAGVRGGEAADLRRRIGERRAHRAAVLDRIAAVEGRAGEVDGFVLQAELASLLEGERDPLCADWIRTARSRLADRLALLHHAGPRRDDQAAARLAAEQQAHFEDERREARERELLVAMVLRDIERALAERRWRYCMRMTDMALQDAPGESTRLFGLRGEIERRSLEDARELLARALEVEAADGPFEALRLLGRALDRFHDGAAREQVAAAREGVERRHDALVRADGHRPAAGDELSQARAHAARAAELAADGALGEARELYFAAAAAAPGTAERDLWLAEAFLAGARHALRVELVHAFERDPRALRPEGVVRVDAEGLRLAGGVHAWGEVELATLERLARAVRPSQAARVGLAAERLARGEGALDELARLHEAGAIDALDWWRLLARMRGEAVPAGGYVRAGQSWVARAEHEQHMLEEEAARLAGLLARSSEEERDARFLALAGLVEREEALGPVLADVLGRRQARALEQLGKSTATLAALERLAGRRAALDRAREHALALIFDLERYFDPHEPPACPPERAKLYPAVQAEVDERVLAVREQWEGGERVELSSRVREALDELRWLSGRSDWTVHAPPPPAQLPDWLLEGLARCERSVELATFAWDADEARLLALDRAVRARNEALWSAGGKLPDARADAEEQEQVRATNDYRAMLGRRALAWSPRLQEAAAMHAEYMSRTGVVGHFQEDPARRTPFDRMRLAGYRVGAAENCKGLARSALDAHFAWLRSSGHHRNILAPAHREVASAEAGTYWAQVFGLDDEFEKELDD